MYTSHYHEALQALNNELRKALGASGAAPLIKESLDAEAHTQLWSETTPTELVPIKILAQQPVTSILHDYDKITSYGGSAHDGHYAGDGLPAASDIVSVKERVTIKLTGTISSVYGLSALQTPIMALGESNLVEQNMAAARLNLMNKMCVNIYENNTRTTTHTLRYAGLYQLIQEGTGVSTSHPFTTNTDFVVDLRGGKLTPAEIRNRAIQVAEYHGAMRWLLMSPEVSGFLEESVDPKERLSIPLNRANNRIMIGQNIGGMYTGGSELRFAVDNTLTPRLSRGAAPTVAAANAPTAPTIGTPTAAANAASKWVAADANAVTIYHVCALNANGSSLPTVSDPVAVVAGDRVTLQITPRAADTSFRIYRSPAAGLTPLFITEIIGPGNTTPFNFLDDNDNIPGTSRVYGLNIDTTNADAFYGNNVEMVDFGYRGRARNTVWLPRLGPWMPVVELARVNHTASNDLIFSAFCAKITHPFQNVVWINVGSR